MISAESVELTLPEWLRKIRVQWELSEDQFCALLRVSSEDFRREIMKTRESALAGPILPPGFESAAPLIRVFQSLAARYPETEDQVKWLFTAHQDFGGSKPIDVAASSAENLSWISYYLDSSRAAKTPRDSSD